MINFTQGNWNGLLWLAELDCFLLKMPFFGLFVSNVLAISLLTNDSRQLACFALVG